MKQFRGVYGILPMPYKENLDIDYEVIAELTKFMAAGHVHGIVMPVMVSEFWLLSEEERRKVVDATVKAADGKIPVVAGVATNYNKTAVELAAYCSKAGADAVIAMPPIVTHPMGDEIIRFYEQINNAVDVPVFIQNAGPPMGTPLSPEQLISVFSQFENIRYVKEETMGAERKMSAIIKFANESNLPENKFMGVMGGNGGKNMIDEHMRGVCGNMPACEIADILASVWDKLDAGQFQEAMSLFQIALCSVNLEQVYGADYWKFVLKKRGVLKNTLNRVNAGVPIDEGATNYMEAVYKQIEPYFQV